MDHPDTQSSSSPPSELVGQLRALRRRRRLKHWPFLALLALMIVFLTLRASFQSFNGSILELALMVAIGLGLIPALLLLFTTVLHLRCPRCHDFFHCGTNPRFNEFAQACVHCGLRLDGKNAEKGANTSLERTHEG